MKTFLFICGFLLAGGILWAQTSDVVLGCAPLPVAFTAPAGQSTFFWDFQNGNQSTDANPSAVFDTPGVYDVRLYEGMGGALVGSITITVLEEPQLMISVSEDMVCVPFEVAFTNNSVLPDQISNPVFNWTFGDGDAQEGENVVHTYTTPGVYDISLRLRSELTACNQEVPFPDIITALAAAPAVQFVANPTVSCILPVTVTFNNTTAHLPGSTYFWDFGNGVTSTERFPAAQTYTAAGAYTVVLRVVTEAGCEASGSQVLTFNNGVPEINLQVPDSICVGVPFTFDNATAQTSFSWTFSNGATSSEANPTVFFQETGTVSITLVAGTGDCAAQRSFTVEVYQPDASFTIAPSHFCAYGDEVTLQANNPNYPLYTWRFHEDVNAPTLITTILGTPQDSFHINTPTATHFSLMVTDANGCTAVHQDSVIVHEPWAHFGLSRVSGCLPIDVYLDDLSTAATDIVSWEWIFGDGTSILANNNDTQMHTYTEAGFYYPRLIIEDSNGCRDTSDAVRVTVGDVIDNLDFTLSDDTFCLGDSIRLASVTMDDRIDAWHFSTDDNRSFHCYQEESLTHVFISEPGSYDITMMVEYNGCYSSITKTDTIEVLGPLAKIGFMAVCETPYDVMFTDLSVQAATTTWLIPGLDTFPGTNLAFTYTFPDRGTYPIYLEATNPSTGCPTHRDTVEIIISDITADFPIEDYYCKGQHILLSASESKGVDSDCFKGYTWILPGNPRPRTIDDQTIDYTVAGSGEVPYTLIVEDTNGCKDTLTQTTRVYSVEADFEVNRDLVCLPVELAFTDLTTADTLISTWQWSFGALIPNPTHLFEGAAGDSIRVYLTVRDTLGCSDTLSRIIPVYEPYSIMGVSPGNVICMGEPLVLTATDFTQQGSHLDFNWDFGNGQNSSAQNPEAIRYETPGTYTISLLIEEQASGCRDTIVQTIDVLQVPTANFSSSVDDLAARCAGQVAFTDLSTPPGSNLTWTFSTPDGSLVAPPTSQANPSFFLERGTTVVELVAANSLGCADTLVRLIDLVAPQGLIQLDNNQLCLNQSFTLTATGLTDVTSFLWDFGDGATVSNTNPVTHRYTTMPQLARNRIRLILYTGDESCETIIDTLVFLQEVVADFSASALNPADCSIDFTDQSVGAASYRWDFGDGGRSQASDPTHIFPLPPGVSSDTFQVQLVVSNSTGLCSDTTTATVLVEIDLDNIQLPNAFTPNGEEPNNYFNFVVVSGGASGDIVVNRFQIFNRWGQLVYNNETPTTGWDGTVRGKEAPEAVYAFVVELELKNGFRFEKKGNVTLLRPN